MGVIDKPWGAFSKYERRLGVGGGLPIVVTITRSNDDVMLLGND